MIGAIPAKTLLRKVNLASCSNDNLYVNNHLLFYLRAFMETEIYIFNDREELADRLASDFQGL
jgi:hypothetical protein